MDINIRLLNIGDGDAIIVHLSKNSADRLVILIDAGHPGDAGKCIEALTPVLAAAGKPAPDLVVCTHYDNDHIGGLKAVIQKYGKAIKEVWMHKPGILMKVAEQAQILLLEHRKANKGSNLLKDFEEFIGMGKENARELVLESYNQMKDLVDTIDHLGIKTVQPFAGQKYDGWNELTVLGPSRPFYNDCIAKMKDVPSIVEAEADLVYSENKKPPLKGGIARLFEQSNDPCGFLQSQPKDHVTEVNQISIIIQIAIGDKTYLFTGDASIESFKALPGYPGCITGLHWLKVPHHGSHNNSSPELFDIMRPKYADISGGPRYLDEEVPECLQRKGVNVRTTLDTQTDLLFPY